MGQPVRRWLWFGLVVEAAKPVVGMAQGLHYFAECLHSAARGVYSDLVAHYNYLRDQDNFKQQVAHDLERLPES